MGIRLLLLEIPYECLHQRIATTIWNDNAAALTRSGKRLLTGALNTSLCERLIVNCEKIDTKGNCSDVMTKAVTAIIIKTLLPRLLRRLSTCGCCSEDN